MSRFKTMLIVALAVAAAAQINISLFTSDFKVSVGVILFPILLFLLRDLNAMATGIVVAAMVYISRVAVYALGSGTFNEVLLAYFPEVLFYTFYGLIYEFLSRQNLGQDLFSRFLILIICDFCSNLIEINARLGERFFVSVLEIAGVLLIVAVLRSSIVGAVLVSLKYYKLFILKEEHEERYLKLLWMTSRLRTEMYWMEKNMDNIERVMSNAYGLFEKISQGREQNAWASLAVTIAKDVHEIKKEYNLVFQGLEEIIDHKLKDPGMHFKDMLAILRNSMENEAGFRKQSMEFNFKMENNFFTTKHYYLMSIFRNLIVNAMEAMSVGSGKHKISLTQQERGSYYLFRVEDTGSGIKQENLELIFSPGFSTKIDYSTGQVNRGLGLSLVKNVVEEYLGGKIEVQSEEGIGTIFTITIPKRALEVTSQ